MSKYTFTDFPFIVFARSGKIFKSICRFNQKYGSLRKFIIHFEINRKRKRAYLRILVIKFSFARMIWRKNI